MSRDHRLAALHWLAQCPHEMGGQALIEHIRTQRWKKSAPALRVTNETHQGRLAAVEELGVAGLCDKPFDPATVRALRAACRPTRPRPGQIG